MAMCGIIFTALTAVRPTEARLATWDEIDLKDDLWTIEAHRMKKKKAHVVPLTKQMKEVLRRMELVGGNEGYIFKSTRHKKPLSDAAVMSYIKDNDWTDTTTHGLRSSFAVYSAMQGTNPDLIGMCLSHQHQKGAVFEAYQRSTLVEDRRPIMEVWNNYLWPKHMFEEQGLFPHYEG